MSPVIPRVLQLSSESEAHISNSSEVTTDIRDDKIPTSIWILGSMMFLINLSFVMVYSLLPVYLKTVVGVSLFGIGFLEGIVEAASYAAKLFSGVLSDYFRKRKFIMVIGYAMMVFARPIMAIANTYSLVFLSRMTERIGNGIQATPRDAFVGDIAPAHRRGACFGLKRSLGVAGSFLGGISATGAMLLTANNYQQVFWLATIPAVISIMILILFIKEPKHHEYPQKVDPQSIVKPTRQPVRFSDLPLLGKNYWMLMGVSFMFLVARFSEAFLMTHANENFGLAPEYGPLIMMIYNTTYCLSSYPMAALSDRMNRYAFLAFGIIVLVLADIVLFAAPNLPIMLMGVALWGLQIGIVQSISAALIIDLVPTDLRGTALGFYHLIGAISAVIAGMGAGKIAQLYGEGASFFTSAIIAVFAVLLLLSFMPTSRRRRKRAAREQ